MYVCGDLGVIVKTVINVVVYYRYIRQDES